MKSALLMAVGSLALALVLTLPALAAPMAYQTQLAIYRSAEEPATPSDNEGEYGTQQGTEDATQPPATATDENVVIEEEDAEEYANGAELPPIPEPPDSSAIEEGDSSTNYTPSYHTTPDAGTGFSLEGQEMRPAKPDDIGPWE